MPPRKKPVTPQNTQTEGLSTDAASQRIAELEAMVAKLLEAQAPTPAPAPATDEQNERIRQLEGALIHTRKKASAARNLAEAAADEEVFEVTNVLGSTVSLVFSDHRGQEMRAQLDGKGSVAFLTASQILEVKDRAPFLFNAGYITAPEVLEPSPNAISDFDAFLRDTSIEEAHTRITKITSPDVLMSLFHHIENQRFVTEDENGRMLTDEKGVPQVREVPLGPKLEVVLSAISQRVRELTGTSLSRDTSE